MQESFSGFPASEFRPEWKVFNLLIHCLSSLSRSYGLRCTIFKQDSFNIKLHIVCKISALVLAIISLLDQPKTLLLSLHLEKGVTFFVSIVCRFLFLLKSQVFSPTNYAMEFLLLFFQLFFWEKGRRGRGLVPSVVIRSQQILDSSDAFLAMCRCFFT